MFFFLSIVGPQSRPNGLRKKKRKKKTKGKRKKMPKKMLPKSVRPKKQRNRNILKLHIKYALFYGETSMKRA